MLNEGFANELNFWQFVDELGFDRAYIEYVIFVEATGVVVRKTETDLMGPKFRVLESSA